MTRIFIFLFILFIPSILFSQSIDSTKASKIEIGFSYSPDYCFRSLKSDASTKAIVELRDTLEIPKFGFTTGLNVVFNFTNKISFSSGILFSDKGEKTNKYSLENPNSGKLPVSNIFIYHYQYIDIPIKTTYYILRGKIKLFLSAGISTNIFIAQKTTSILEYGDGHTEINESSVGSGFSKVNFAFIAGLGLDCPLSDKFTFKIEPVFRHSITSIIDAPVKEYLYSAGLNIGVYYKF